FETEIGPEETAGELGTRLARIAAQAVTAGVPKVLAGAYVPQKQNDADMTLAPILKKEDGAIDWKKSAKEIHDHVRGMSPWPGAFTRAKGKIVKVHSTRIPAEIAASSQKQADPGTVVFADKVRVLVACGSGVLELGRVQLEGKKAIAAHEWHLGRGVIAGEVLGS
ncbi:MAG: methionyl-tRNA formyltransferase, partial [Polyangiaceae bacterium]